MQLIEHSTWASDAIDTEAGVIKGVKILGTKSKNGREYSATILEQAKGKYEGLGINLDHQKGNRRVSDGFGRIRGVELRQDGLYGDLEYLKSHPFAGQFVESAERMPEQVGLSHSAEGRVSKQGDREVVEEISEVYSVDVVRYPATTKGLFESNDPEPLKVVVVKDLSEDDPPAEDPPAEDPPAEDPPAEDPPAEDPPVEDPPAEEDAPTVESLQQDMRDLQHRLDISEALLAANVDVSALTESQSAELRSKQTREEIEAFVESLPQMTRRQPRKTSDQPSSYSQLREEIVRSRRSSRFGRAV